MLRSCLPDFSFHGCGAHLGPQVIIADICREERNTLKSVWRSTILLLCIFHVFQQLWRWLHENSHNIHQTDRPHIPVFLRYPVVSYPWTFRTQTIRTQARTFHTQLSVGLYPTLWSICTQQIMTQSVKKQT